MLAGLLAAAVAATLTADTSRDEARARAPEARAELRAISTRLDGARSQILIEASEPVGYVTSQPDPLTVIVDLRNVKAGVMPPGLDPLPPVANIRVEEAIAGDGAEVARVRVTLAYAAKHRVRSSRNVIYVEVDRGVVPHDKPLNGVEGVEVREGREEECEGGEGRGGKPARHRAEGVSGGGIMEVSCAARPLHC